MRTGRVSEIQNFRFSNYRRLRIFQTSKIPRLPAESLPFLVLNRLSLIQTVPVAEFYLSQGHRYLRLINQLPICLKFLVQFKRRTTIQNQTQQQIIMEPFLSDEIEGKIYLTNKISINFLFSFCLFFSHKIIFLIIVGLNALIEDIVTPCRQKELIQLRREVQKLKEEKAFLIDQLKATRSSLTNTMDANRYLGEENTHLRIQKTQHMAFT